MKMIQNDIADKFRLMMFRKSTPDVPWEQITVVIPKGKTIDRMDFIDDDKTKLLLTLKDVK